LAEQAGAPASNGHGPTGRTVAERATVVATVGARAPVAAKATAPVSTPATVPAAIPYPSDDFGGAPSIRPAAPPRPQPRPAPRRAGRRRPAGVLVTGAGGPAGVAVIRALGAAGHPTIAADSDGLAVGLRLGAGSGVLPRADDDTFVERLCDLALEWGATAVVPTVAEELVALADAGEVLAEAGIAHWLPAPAAVRACTDKWRFAQVLSEHGIPGPATNLGSAEGVAGAWIVKPRFGRGSRDVIAVDRPDELAWALGKVPQPIVQTRLSGREFTVDALVDRDGALAGAVPRWRLETKAGISTKGRTFEDEALCTGVGRVLTAVGLQGPANVQGFVDDEGNAAFVEVNPRFSGGLPLSLAAGADLVGEYVRAILGEPVRRERLAFRPGVTMLRHFEEVFE
jgi:carbamoyl-phosphate synthase large subunit